MVYEHVPGSRLSHETRQLKTLQSRLGGLGGSPFTKLWVLRANNSHSIRNKQTNKARLDFRTQIWGGHRNTRYSTWNVRSLLSKEVDLANELRKLNLHITAITETKKNEKGCEVLEGGHHLFFLEMPAAERVRGRVACLVIKVM